jgi:hypothetical protein
LRLSDSDSPEHFDDDSPEFSYEQLHVIIEMAVKKFAETNGLPESYFNEVLQVQQEMRKATGALNGPHNF